MSTPLNDRIATLINHAEAFADEAADIGLHDITDTLRLGASRLAIDGELVDAALEALTTKKTARAEAITKLRACLHRVEIELCNRFPTEPTSLATARLPTLETARYRLRRLKPAHVVVLGALEPALRAAIDDVEQQSEAVLAATERYWVMHARATSRMWTLRLECERSKAVLLEVLTSTSPAAERVRRRIVRTRRPDVRSVWVSRNSTDGEPIE